MTRRGQYGCVLAALLVCLALTIGFVGSPQPARDAQPAGGDDIPFPTWDLPSWEPKSASPRPRVPAPIVPEGVAILLVTVIWTTCRALLSGRRLGHHSIRQVLTTLFSGRASAGGRRQPATHTTNRRRSLG